MADLRGVTAASIHRGLVRMTHEKETQERVRGNAEELVNRARRIYVRRARHPNTVRPFYLKSFVIRKKREGRREGYEVANTDPTWIWIEWGAHAGGKTRILRYRPMGRAMDEMKGAISGA